MVLYCINNIYIYNIKNIILSSSFPSPSISLPSLTCDFGCYLIEHFLLLLLSDLGNARVIIEAVLLIETITPLLT